MGKRSRVYSTTPLSKIDGKLFSYDVNKKSEKVYTDKCEACGKVFQFMSKDVKDRLIKCPYCKHDMVFFTFKY